MIGDSSFPQPPVQGLHYRPGGGVTAPASDAAPVPAGSVGDGGIDWLRLAREAYDSSESWMQANIRQQWARSLANYRSEHPQGSKYHTDTYKHRARYFRPKSRALVRAIQAAGASAYFSSADIVVMDPEDADNPFQVEAAKFMKSLLNHRLTKTIPWYRLVLGALGEGATLGTVVSHQSWVFEEETLSEQMAPDGTLIREVRVVKDRPDVRLVSAENLRISPAASWLDPVNTSPYVVELIPMFACDVLEKAKQNEAKTGEPDWRRVELSALLSAGVRDNLEPIRRAREGQGRIDSKANTTESQQEFQTVWIHRNIVRQGGKDWLFYSAGTTLLLSDAVPLAEVIPWADGQRDYVVGCLEIETDRPYPASPVEIAQGLQSLANEISNQRIDNVRQVLNKRTLYKQNAGVDVKALVRNVPGAAIPLMNMEDVKPLDVADVTGSSYQEQDRINLDYDDLTGQMSGSTVQANRKLNETVGGMELMGQGANLVREMELRTFTETWMEPVLRQLCRLEAYYETDETVMAVAARKAGLRQVLEEYFLQEFAVSVNVGIGATNPAQRMQRFQMGVQTALAVAPQSAASLNVPEVIKEIFANIGYQDGSRFFNFDAPAPQQPPDPRAQAMAEQTQVKREELQLKSELEHRKLDLMEDEIRARVDQIISDSTKANIDAIFSAMQAAGLIVMNPASAPMADALLKSGGYKDHDQPPIVPEPQGAAQQPVMPPQNTHPTYPAHADVGVGRGAHTLSPLDGQPIRNFR